MSAMELIVDTYLANHGLADNEDAKEQLIVVINDCFKAYVDHMHHEFLTTPAPKETTKSTGSTKQATGQTKPVILPPDECTTKDQLLKCTITTLTTFCKERSLKVGGKKDEVVDRVWRHLQGESSDEDHNPKLRKAATTAPSLATKPKRPSGVTGGRQGKVPAIHHNCEGVTKTGKPCVLEGTLCNPIAEGGEQWFCWRHTPTATGASGSTAPPANQQSSDSEGDSDTSGESSAPPPVTAAAATPKKTKRPPTTPKPKKVVAVSPPPPPPLEEEP